MKDWQSFFKDKKITVMGLGLLGRALGDVRFLAECGAELIVTDLKTEEQLKDSLDSLKQFSNITFVLGHHRLEDFQNRDFILKAAGVPLDSEYIEEARKNNIPIEMSTSLFASFTPATIVGITGTRGKSTVTQLLYEILKIAYEGTDKTIFLGGNVRGISTLPYLKDTKEGDIAVLELDSWQLQGFGERKISPHVALFTTFFNDHLNYYKNDLEKYFADKAHIFTHQTPSDYLIVSRQVTDTPYFPEYKSSIKSTIIIPDQTSVPIGTKISLPGDHNKNNVDIACVAAKVLGVPDDIIRTGVEVFPGVPGRLEKIREMRGISFYNDTNSTTPDATVAALQALGTFKNIVLIMGGADKNINMSKLFSTIKTTVKHIILLPGTGTDRISNEIHNLGIPVTDVATMQEAVDRAVAKAEAGDILLMSPAFASFGLFKNEYDRGDQFENNVNSLSDKGAVV